MYPDRFCPLDNTKLSAVVKNIAVRFIMLSTTRALRVVRCGDLLSAGNVGRRASGGNSHSLSIWLPNGIGFLALRG